MTPRPLRRHMQAGKLLRVNAFSLVTLIVNIILALMALIFEPTSFYYYLYILVNFVCIGLWFFRGQRPEDFLALSIMFLTMYVLMPAPLNAATHFVFWGSPEVYSSLTSGTPYLCAVFLAAAAVPTLVRVRAPKMVSARKFNLNWKVLFFSMVAMLGYMAAYHALFFSSRIELELASADEGQRALTGIAMVIAPRGIGLAVFLCLIAYVIGHLKDKLPILDLTLLAICLIVCLLYFFPLSIPRQMVMAFGLSSFYFLSWFGVLNRRWLVLIIPLATFVVGPAVSNITRFELTSDFFPVSPDFDCFQSMNVGIDILRLDGLKWGGNLLASLSFFLPSELKIFSSYHLLESPSFHDLLMATNISMPLPVDLYADFGTVGLITETMALFWFLRFSFLQIEASTTNSVQIYRIGTISVIMGGWPAIMRGPMLGNLPVVLIFLLAWVLMSRLLDAAKHWRFRLVAQ